MAPSKCSIAFLFVFAAVAAILRPSSAARVQLEAEEAAPQPPSFWRPRIPLPPIPCIPGLPRPRFLPPCDGSGAPALPLPLPPIPCIPGLPRPSFLPPCDGSSGTAASPPSPQPAECSTSLSGLAPCADFLTANATNFLAAPAAACCDGVRSLVKDAPVCLCHVMSGDLGEILPAPELRLRAVALPRACGVAVPFGTLRHCFRGPVPPMDAPAPPS
ncbi:pEARLI1-like lipid transfer protein 2 [Panicum miliaceum]|uniref:PEARLI1-like lipid transfer protein 2 n=1 Tax=Panicum miliaceum TaxID=4540 RepID=A0A3L6QW65_PANMI|nr:pEARLI1-like lipid transfer protein 2 [Panicum miliaceum]